MTVKTKLWIALLVAVSMIGVVTVLANTIYLPVIEKSPTITPTATATVTPTVTNTPSATPTRTPTPQMEIVDIVYDPPDPLDEYIEIENTGNNSVDMEGWYIKHESDVRRYDFPSGFTLGSNDSVRVWTKIGTDTETNLYMDLTSEFWHNNGDIAYLRDDDGELVHTYSY
jgi:hypothetical protein